MSVVDTAELRPVAIGGAEQFELWDFVGRMTGDATAGIVTMTVTLPGADFYVPIFSSVKTTAASEIGISVRNAVGTAFKSYGATQVLAAGDAAEHGVGTYNFPRTILRADGGWGFFSWAENVDTQVYDFYGTVIRIQPSSLPPNWLTMMVSPP